MIMFEINSICAAAPLSQLFAEVEFGWKKFASFNHVYATVPVRLLMASRCASLCHAF